MFKGIYLGPDRDVTLVELLMLGGMLFFLPLAEAPKNIFLYSFFIYWIYHSVRQCNFGRSDKIYEWPLTVVCFLSLIPAISRVDLKIVALNNCVDFIAISLLLIFLARTRFTARQLDLIFVALLAGTTFAIFDGWRRMDGFPRLHSVGHINQVAQYLGLVATLLIGHAFFSEARSHRNLTTWFFLSTILYLTFLTGSRNTFFGLIVVAILAASILLLLKGNRRLNTISLISFLVIFVGFSVDSEPLQRQIDQTRHEGTLVDNARLKLWKGSLIVMSDAPKLGFGVGFFGEANTPSRVKRITEAQGKEFKETDYYFTNHGHNLWINWAIERGLISLTLFIFWLLYVALLTGMRLRRDVNTLGLRWAVSGFLVLSATLLFGLGNTSWHHEHGMLAAVIIGLSTSLIRYSRDMVIADADFRKLVQD